MAENKTNIGAGRTKFTFTADDGDIVAYFYMNPADVQIAARAAEVAKYFKKEASNHTSAGLEALLEMEDKLVKKISYLLGYDVSDSLFGRMSATTIMEDGRLFVAVVLDTIAKNLSEELKRRAGLARKVNKHTAKYRRK